MKGKNILRGDFLENDITDTELDALEAAARAATPGPWEIGYRDDLVFSEQGAQISYSATITSSEEEHCISAKQATKNAAFIAVANPVVILELIAELRHLQNYANTLAEELLWARNHIDTLEVGMEGIIDKNRILERGMHKGVV